MMNQEPEITQLLKSLLEQNQQEDVTTAIIRKVEEEFSGGSAEDQSRTRERLHIQNQLKSLRSQLKKTRNVRVYSKRNCNKKQADRRKKLKTEIENLEGGLQALKMETAQ